MPRSVPHTRRPHYVSPATQSITIALNGQSPAVVNLTPSSPGCQSVSQGLQCTVPFQAPVGNDTFVLTTFDKTNGAGNQLSTASVTQSIVQGKSNAVDVTLDGIVAKIVLALQGTPPPEDGNTHAIGLSVMAQDADGNTIVGPGEYDNPITLADTNLSATSLSTTTVSDPSTAVTLTYNGKPLSSVGLNAQLTASSLGVASSNVTNVYFVTAQDQWITWGDSPFRNSYNPNETTLTAANVGGLKQLWTTTLGPEQGAVITDEPIVVANVPGTSEGPVDVLYVGDSYANFFALNAGTGTVLWSKTLQKEYVNGHNSDPAENGCFDQPNGYYGVGGTAVADTAASRVYVVDGMGLLYAFDLATGAQKVGPVQMWPYLASGGPYPNFNITNDYGALNEDTANGFVYVPGGAHCGNENYGGVQQYDIASGSVSHFYTEGGPPSNFFGGVWGPGGPVLDPRGNANVYFGTGDGKLGAGQYGYSAMRLNDSLGVVGNNSPAGISSQGDSDFGDTPLVFSPSGCGTLVALANKNGRLYLYNADDLSAGPTQIIQLGTASQNGQNLGTPAYDPATGLVYINNGSDSSDSDGIMHGLVAFSVSGCQLQFAWQVTIGPNNVNDGPPAPPTVANGVVYYVDGPGSGCSAVNPACTNPTPTDFLAVNASSGAILFHTTLTGPFFTPPVVVNGHVYITSWSGRGPGTVYAFGL